MRRFAVLASLAVLMSLPIPAGAHHRPNNHCSPSGDVCLSTRKVDGIRWLRIGLAARYFDRYTLCVRAPDGSRECHRFRITDQGATFGSSIRWGRHFPLKGAGAYAVSWSTGGHRVGRILGFHRRTAAQTV
jgi:hypothetical protein